MLKCSVSSRAHVSFSSPSSLSPRRHTAEQEKRHGVRPEHTATFKVHQKPAFPTSTTRPCIPRIGAVRSDDRVILNRKQWSTYFFFVLVCPEDAGAEMKFHWREGGIEGWRIYTSAAHQSYPPTSRQRVRLHIIYFHIQEVQTLVQLQHFVYMASWDEP